MLLAWLTETPETAVWIKFSQLDIIFCFFFLYRVFPWILEVFNLHGYYFYRVIELLLRAEDGLPRDIVKHLNRVSQPLCYKKDFLSH